MSRHSLPILLLLSLLSCQESLQDKAERQAWDYTRKYCPTPPINHIRTDSITFDRKSNTYNYYCSFTDFLDDQEIINSNQSKIKDVLRGSVSESASMKPYLDAGFHFQYICHSEKDPKKVLLQVKF